MKEIQVCAVTGQNAGQHRMLMASDHHLGTMGKNKTHTHSKLTTHWNHHKIY